MGATMQEGWWATVPIWCGSPSVDGEGEAAFRQEEEGVVAEAPDPARAVQDLAAALALGELALSPRPHPGDHADLREVEGGFRGSRSQGVHARVEGLEGLKELVDLLAS